MKVLSSRVTWCLLVLTITSVSCGNRTTISSGNGGLKEDLAGVWKIAKWNRPNFVEGTITFSNGSWQLHGRFNDSSNLIESVESGGEFQIENGWLILTMLTNSVLTNKPLPPTTLGYQITQQNNSELILNDTNYEAELVLRRTKN